jgi:hypothetical protein
VGGGHALASEGMSQPDAFGGSGGVTQGRTYKDLLDWLRKQGIEVVEEGEAPPAPASGGGGTRVAEAVNQLLEDVAGLRASLGAMDGRLSRLEGERAGAHASPGGGHVDDIVTILERLTRKLARVEELVRRCAGRGAGDVEYEEVCC